MMSCHGPWQLGYIQHHILLCHDKAGGLNHISVETLESLAEAYNSFTPLKQSQMYEEWVSANRCEAGQVTCTRVK
jgi:hypothetical protein